MAVEMISLYRRSNDGGAQRLLITVGDLLNAEERHIVVRFTFPSVDKAYSYTARARTLWIDDRGEQASEWQQITFTSASDQQCSDERRDPEAMRWIGLAHTDRAKGRALELANRGDDQRARELLLLTAGHISQYAGADEELRAAMRDLEALAETIQAHMLDMHSAKTAYFTMHSHSRGQKDYRKDQS
jgi:hypothetical protein